MATSFNSTTAAAFLQRFYSPSFVANSVAKNASKVLGQIKRLPDCGGDTYNFLSVVDEVATGSADFSTAQSVASNSTQTVGSQYSIAWCESNEPVRVSGKMIAQTRNNSAAWMNALKFAMDSGLRVAAHRLSIRLYTQGWGELAVVKAGSVSGATFQCATGGHVYRFFKGMPLVGSSSLNAATLRSATAINVSGVDYSTGIITCDTNLATPGIVAGDTIFTKGDRENSATPSRLCPAGFPAWLPLQPVTDATLSTFYGVTRSSNTRLYGNYVDGRNQSLVDSLQQLAQTCASIGNATKLMAVVSPYQYTALAKALGSDRRYVDVPGKDGYVGFKTLAVMAEGIEVPVISDKYVGDDVAFMFDPAEVELASLGPAPHIDMVDGNKMLRISDDNGIEVRIISWSVIALKNTAACGTIQLA